MTHTGKERIVPITSRDIKRFLRDVEICHVVENPDKLRDLETLFLHFIEERNLDTEEIYNAGYADGSNSSSGHGYENAYDQAKADMESKIDRMLDERWLELSAKLRQEYDTKGREQTQAYEAEKLILENGYAQLQTELCAKIEELKAALLADHTRKDKELKMAYLKGNR